jgi:class 3 adenylate cyclase
MGVSAMSGPSSETVTKWLSAVAQLHRASANSQEFFSDAARFAVETVGLDAAWVLSYTPVNGWQTVGQQALRDLSHELDLAALGALHDRAITHYEPATDVERSQVHAVVLSPVLSSTGDVIGAVYGVRNTHGQNRRRGIRPLEARMMQILAESVAVGIARLAHETEAARTRVLLEQAFSPTVVEHIHQNPECLAGQLREVTLLFADLRGFTSLAEMMPPADCYRLLSEVMEELTEVVIGHQGIVVDYYGDGMLAFWNAPLDQGNHSDLACGAGLAMLDRITALSLEWKGILNEPLELGIGVHTGPVLVGNAGTNSRLKYGPRGSNVNIASRVQAATRELETSLLVTAATKRRLSPKFFTLRTCTARLPGLEQPVELFTVFPTCEAREVKSRLDQYAHALRHFEHGDLIMAEVLLKELVAAGPITPARFLAQQAAIQRGSEFGRRSSDRQMTDHGPIIEIHEK